MMVPFTETDLRFMSIIL